jgi:phospholipid/cholesterol/gamma-HCH transport system permease protein
MPNQLELILGDVGGCVDFVLGLARSLRRARCTFSEIAEQTWRVTIQSLLTTASAGFFVGAIMAVQFTMQIKTFGALGYLGGLATSSTVREVGPLLIAFLLSGKIGAFTAAELGTMRVTEQLDAIRCLGADPMTEIVVPRFFGIIISSFFLLSAGLLTSVLGGALVAALFANINFDEYLRHVPTIVSSVSVASGLFKCLVFALVLASVCTYKGFTASGGAKGVGRNVVATAVMTMIGIVIADWLTSSISQSMLHLLGGPAR